MNPVVQYIVTNAILSYYLNSIPFDTIRFESYDFIVIGGGSAGALVAARLSDESSFKVLLLERGGNSGNFYSDIPFVHGQIGLTEAVKYFKSVPQRRACGATNRICDMSTGNGFGGGSSHNGMLYSRGSPLDYDNWQRVYGAYGWSFRDVLPFYKSIENYRNRSLVRTGLHGTNPNNLLITTPFDYPHLQTAMIAAYANAGYKIGDYNGLNPAVFSVAQETIGDGRRQSSWNVYLEPAVNRPNLDIISFATVNKINFDGNKKAVSVTFTKKNVTRTAYVSREVIISAGAIDTPKLLMLSGIGDANELSRLGVNPIVSNLPSVGKSFQDQIELPINLTFNGVNTEPTFADYEQYKVDRSGILTKNGNLIIGFFKDKFTSKSYQDTRVEIQYAVDQQANILFVFFNVLGTKSRGTIKLSSNDPNDDPLIDPNFYADPEDLPILKRALKDFARFMLKSRIMIQNNISINQTFVEGCGIVSAQSLLNDNYLDCYIRMTTISAIHMSSSCRMGPRNSPLSCVDPRLKLLGGIKNVRVMDASVMPQVVRGNTNAATTMIAEKGSRMLLSDYGY